MTLLMYHDCGTSQNSSIIFWLQRQGIAGKRGRYEHSRTTLMKDRWWYRINPVNFRTTIAHMDDLFETLGRECAEVEAELGVKG